MPDDDNRRERAERSLEKLRQLSATAEEKRELQQEREQAGLAPALTLTEQRVDAIIDTMLSGGWVAGQSARSLAKLWTLSPERVEGLAAEASRTIRRYMREDEQTRKDALNEAMVSFDRLAKKAEALGTSNGFRVAKDTRVDKLTFMGLKPATKHIIRKDEMSDWTDAELAEFAASGKRPEGKE